MADTLVIGSSSNAFSHAFKVAHLAAGGLLISGAGFRMNAFLHAFKVAHLATGQDESSARKGA